MDDRSGTDLVAEARARLEESAGKGDEARVQVLEELLAKLESELDEDGSSGR